MMCVCVCVCVCTFSCQYCLRVKLNRLHYLIVIKQAQICLCILGKQHYCAVPGQYFNMMYGILSCIALHPEQTQQYCAVPVQHFNIMYGI